MTVTWEGMTGPGRGGVIAWWRGTWPGCGPAYLSVAYRGGVYAWAWRTRPGSTNIADQGHANTLQAAQHEAEEAAGVTRADMSATLAPMTMTKSERGRVANAALTTEQRSAAGRARAAMLHHPTSLARRIAKAWPDLSDDDRREVRRSLREAGVIK